MNTDALAATVVAAVRARGPQRLSTVETIADATGLSPRDVRAGLTAARLAGQIDRRVGGLGVVYSVRQ